MVDSCSIRCSKDTFFSLFLLKTFTCLLVGTLWVFCTIWWSKMWKWRWWWKLPQLCGVALLKQRLAECRRSWVNESSGMPLSHNLSHNIACQRPEQRFSVVLSLSHDKSEEILPLMQLSRVFISPTTHLSNVNALCVDPASAQRSRERHQWQAIFLF